MSHVRDREENGLNEVENELVALRNEVRVLRSAIEEHRSQKADDRCIEDDDRLYAALGDGIKCDRSVGSKEEMLKNCARFIERRCEGGKWPTYAELDKEVKVLRETKLQLDNYKEQWKRHYESLGLHLHEQFKERWSKHLNDEVTDVGEKALELFSENLDLRKLLWLRHGCLHLYGDDGEMQCGSCLLDFRRESPKEIEERFQSQGLAALAAAQLQVQAPPK